MEKQIEEMAMTPLDFLANDINQHCPDLADNYCGDTHCIACLTNALYNAGYRRKSDVIDEFAKMLKEKMNYLSRMEYHCDPYFLVSKAFIDEIAEEMKGGSE